MTSGRRVAIVIPTLNEEAHIGDLLAQLTRSAASVSDILVADGGSRDRTRAIVERMGEAEARIRLVDNPLRRQSAGINRAVSLLGAEPDTLIRIDAHSRYPDDYVTRLVEAIERTGADAVASRLETVGDGCIQRAIAAAANSRLGSGGSAHRVGGESGWVDHGHHAAFDRAAFERVGGYDESFDANEDAELDARLRRAGGRIWLATDIVVTYFPRSTLGALARQYRRYGEGRARTFLKHGERLKPRQLLPVGLLGLFVAAMAASVAAPVALLAPAAYLLAVCAAGAVAAVRMRSACVLLMGPAIATMHLAWGWGFVMGYWRWRRERGKLAAA